MSIFEPCDYGSGERGEGRRADDRCSALRHRLSLLLGGEVSQNWRKREQLNRMQSFHKMCGFIVELSLGFGAGQTTTRQAFYPCKFLHDGILFSSDHYRH